MKKIFTYSIILIAALVISGNSKSQNCSQVQPNVTACDNVIENFNSGAGGFMGVNLAHTSNSFSTTLSNNVSPATLSIISPAYYKLEVMPNTIVAGYTLNVGFKVTVTSITLQVLDAGNGDQLIASCLQNTDINNTQVPVCLSATSNAIQPGMMLKYKFIFNVTIAMGGNNSQNSISVDNFTTALGLNATLPVKFGIFQARFSGNTTQLNWKVETEENTGGYDIERSADGKNFFVVGSVVAKGAGTYSFLDATTFANAFYRIAAKDLDGRRYYSVIIKVNGGESSTMTKAFWRQKDLLVAQHDALTEPALIQVLTAEGKLVYSVVLNPGSQETIVNTASCRPGLMIVRLVSAGPKADVIKLVKN
jgi:hypothetical protein